MQHGATVSRLVASLLLAGTWLACGDELGEPVARVSAEPARLTLPHGTMVPVALDWEIRRPLEAGALPPLVFVHLVDEEGAVARTFDHAFPADWKPGRAVNDTLHLYHSRIAPALAPGSYRLTVGLYDGASRRWALLAEGEPVDSGEYPVAQVEVPAARSTTAQVRFSPSWRPLEPGDDRQAVALRWLAGEGAVRVLDLPEEPWELWLVLRIPDTMDGFRLESLGDATPGPAVRLRSSCGGFSANLAGGGRHEVRVPLPARADGCRLVLRPDFVWVEERGERRYSVALEQLALRPEDSSGGASAPRPGSRDEAAD